MSHYAAVDLGGTKIAAAIATADGEFVAEDKVPTDSHAGPDAVLQRVADTVNRLAEESGRRPEAVGMGVPGLVDLPTGTTKFLPNLPTKWRDVPAAGTLSEKIGCPVHLLNDVRTITLGELTFGHGKDESVKTMAYFALGTGVGGGVVIDGKLRLGPLGAAGELGHQTILADGPLCGCGNRGCLETLCSGPAIASEGVRMLKSGLAPKLHEIAGGDPENVTAREMAEAAAAGDENVVDALQRAGAYLGIGIANIVTALHPELVVIGGGVANIGDVLLNPARETVAKRVRMFPSEMVRIEQSKLGGKAALLGGIALAMKGGYANV
jgi:glucokinase